MDAAGRSPDPVERRPARRWPWLPEAALGAGLRGAGAAPLARDLVAGAVVAAMLVPQAMAYAALAGLPPAAGLNASLAALLVYGLLGASRSLSVAPVAVDSLLTAQALAVLAVLLAPDAVRLAGVLALLVAAMYLAGWLLRVGTLAAHIGAPILLGFTHAAALVIAFSQVRHLGRVPSADGGRPWEVVASTVRHAPEAHALTLALGLGCLSVLVLWRRWGAALLSRLGMPLHVAAALGRAAPLLAVVLAGAATALFQLDRRGVATVGEVPAGLPLLRWPQASGAEWAALLPWAGLIALVGFLECLAIARVLARRREEALRPGAELLGLALSNAASGLAGGFPVTAGLSRSMVNHQAGATSGRASLVTAALLALAVTFLAPAFATIPRAALAAVVLVAISALIDLRGWSALARSDEPGLALAVLTFLVGLGLGLEWGLAAGLAAALLLRLSRGTVRRRTARTP